MSGRRDTVARLDRIATAYARNPAVHDLSITLVQPRTGLAWSAGTPGRSYFIASITKLFTTAVVMQLRADGAFDLDTPVSALVGEETMRGLVVHRGVDHGRQVTVGHLLSHRSGIPDYYEPKGADGRRLADVMWADDRYRRFEELIEHARGARSPFPPREHGRGHYSDTNFQLLGRIIESVSAAAYVDVVRRRIIEPLGLADTWHVTPATAERFSEVSVVYRGQARFAAPASLASTAPDGGLVSTGRDQVRFLQAFMGGELFDSTYLAGMTRSPHKLDPGFGPLKYGVGLMHFALPRWQALGQQVPAMLGHSGSFGSLLFYAPAIDLYVAATVNQARPRRLPYPLLARLALACR